MRNLRKWKSGPIKYLDNYLVITPPDMAFMYPLGRVTDSISPDKMSGSALMGNILCIGCVGERPFRPLDIVITWVMRYLYI